MTFMTWRQQACLVMALPRLAAGERVTSVAMALGYDNPAALTAMFQRTLGASPRAYFARRGTRAVLFGRMDARPLHRPHSPSKDGRP